MIKRNPKTAGLLSILALAGFTAFTIPVNTALADGSHWKSHSGNHNSHSKYRKEVEYYKVTKTRKVKEYHYGNHNAHNRNGHNQWKYKKKVTYYEVAEPHHRHHNGHGSHHSGWHKKPAHSHKSHRSHHRDRNSDSSGGFNINKILGGRIIGALLGGAAGTQFGKGRGRTVAIIGGAILGSVIGGEVGKSMEKSDHQQVSNILETAPTGQTITWNNPQTGRQYQMTPTRTYKTSSNLPCRDYTSWVFIDGFEEQVKGKACRMSDGRWKMMS